jgi:hypothetical protein
LSDSKIGSTIFSPHWTERFDAVREPAHLELRADRQQIGVVGARMQRREGGRMRVGDDQQVQRVHAALRVLHPRHGVAAVAEDDHRLDVVALVDLLGVDAASRRTSGSR